MRAMRFTLTAVILLAATAGEVQASFIIDQQNTVSDIASKGSTVVGQSFTPTLAGIDFATFNINTLGEEDVLRVDLFAGAGYDGALLSSSAPETVTSSTLQPIQFTFPTTVALTPMSVYTLRLVLVSGSPYGASYGSATFGGAGKGGAVDGADPYALGTAFNDDGSADLDRDLVFSEGVFSNTTTTPEPTSLALAGCAGLGMAVGAWRRRRPQAA